LSLYLVRQHTVTTYGQVKVELQAFSTLDDGQLHALDAVSHGRTPALEAVRLQRRQSKTSSSST
jgi:hypothetical protein